MPVFDIFASPRWSPLRMRTKVVSFFIFFQELSNKKKIKALRPKMTKIASRGGPALKWSLSQKITKIEIFQKMLLRDLENKFNAKNFEFRWGKVIFSDLYAPYSHKLAYTNATLTGCISKLCSGTILRHHYKARNSTFDEYHFWSLLKVPFNRDLLVKTVWKNSVAKLV